MGVTRVPARRATPFDLEHYVRVRGLVPRGNLAKRLDALRGSTILELRGGAGWGKTSAALLHAAERQRAGSEVVVFETGGTVRVCPAAGDDVLYVVDDRTLSAEVVDELLSRAQDDPCVHILVCSREQHPLAAEAVQRGLVLHRVDADDVRMTAAEIIEVARRRNVMLDAQRAAYVSSTTLGWPAVAAGFVALYADSSRDGSLATIDRLVSHSFETVLNDLLGQSAVPLLARASLSAGFEHAEDADAAAMSELIDRVHTLGLGRWVAA